jgi:hypothetical protein
MAAITLSTPLDANTFDELVVAGRKAVAAIGLSDRIDLAEPVELPSPPPGGVLDLTQFATSRRVIFRRLDAEKVAVDELSIGMQRIAVGTLRYRRWSDLFGLLTTSLTALDAIFPITQRAKAVRVEFVDRFQSIPGGADHFEIIRRDSEYLTPVVARKEAALHVHSGWFDFEEGPDVRRLTNINIDVNDIPIPPPPDPRRKISVLSIGQFENFKVFLTDPWSG